MADNTGVFPYKVTIEGGAKQKTTLGKIHTKATVETAGLTGGVVFYAVAIEDVDALLGKGAGQKLATSPFSDSASTICATIKWSTVFPPTPTPTVVPTQRQGNGNLSNAATRKRMRMDPFGIVFDSQSLEPMRGVKITIFDENKNKYDLIGLTNPQITAADGLFNFLVEPGTYYLSLEVPSGYSFSSGANLHPNYVKIYHKMDGTDSIYRPDEPIVEEIDTPEEEVNGYPDMEHRDIPLDPGGNPPYHVAPSTISYSMIRVGNTLRVSGKNSHPLSEVVFSQNQGKIIQVKADRFGFYDVDLDNRYLVQDEPINVTYIKENLTATELENQASFFKRIISVFMKKILSPFVGSSLAQMRIRIDDNNSSDYSLTLNPIFSYLEGFAYDDRNNIVPNARVRVKLKMNNATVYETDADKNGYFKIEPKHIPLFPYDIEIANNQGGDVLGMSTSQFASKNKEFLKKERINLLAATKADKPVITPTVTKNREIQEVNNDQSFAQTKTLGKSAGQTASSEKQSGGAALLLVFMIVFFSILAGVTAFFIFKKRQSTF